MKISSSPIEKTISFYTRNDFAILNNLLIGNEDDLWKYAWIAYHDNRCIMNEYKNKERIINSDYDIKWLNCLEERLLDRLDENAKRKIIGIARNDIANILDAMTPAKEQSVLF